MAKKEINIMTGKEEYLEVLNGMIEELTSMVALLVELKGWAAMFEVLQCVCWQRNDPHTAGVLLAAQGFIRDKK